jgi:hypothetical protein
LIVEPIERTEGRPETDSPEQAPAASASPPPDPAAYVSERAAAARARGLAAPYIAGGRDPDPETARREERFYGKLLLAMVAVIVLAGFVLGIVANVIGAVGR